MAHTFELPKLSQRKVSPRKSNVGSAGSTGRLSPKKATKFRKIKLSQGKYAIVDASDYEFLSQWKWHAHLSGRSKTFYAIRNVYLGKIAPGQYSKKALKMHRLLMKARPSQLVDHINGNGLDNRRKNLRFADAAQSIWNRKGSTGVTQVKGPHGASYIIGRVSLRGVRHYLGVFKTKLAARRAVQAFKRKHRGSAWTT